MVSDLPLTIQLMQWAALQRGGPTFEGVDRLNRALQALPETQARVIYAEYLGSGSRIERARTLGLPRPNYYLLLRHSLDTLEALLRVL